MTADLGTLRDALDDMTLERNAALREIERLQNNCAFWEKCYWQLIDEVNQ